MNAFYKGAAIALSGRLRETNLTLQSQIREAQKLVETLMERDHVANHLIQTRVVVEDTGSVIVQKLADVIPQLRELKSQHPEMAARLEELELKLEDVFLVESQKFDRIAQQLHLIYQHFENIRRVATAGQPLPVRGDKSLFA